MRLIVCLMLFAIACTDTRSQTGRTVDTPKKAPETVMNKPRIKVDIWSDIMCPFCYIGKRHFEKALEQSGLKDSVEIEWHSFQLDPDLPMKASEKHIYDYLAESKGISRSQSVSMHDRVYQMAQEAGLNYNFDKIIVVNSFTAHRLIQFARTKGLDDAMEEALFKAYFIEGKNMADITTLTTLAVQTGLNKEEVIAMLNSDQYSDEVKKDIHDAAQIGVTGVPFFVFNDSFAVSGAQPVNIFINALKKAGN